MLPGQKHTIETIKKMSESHKGHTTSQETRDKISKSEKGKRLSTKTKKKISKATKGMKRSAEACKRIGEGHKGIRPSEEVRRKMSEARKGSKSCNWKGGISKENHIIRQSVEFRLWREAVFARDNWICQRCKERGRTLHPHHILNFADYPKLRFEIDNGITLCKKCHKEFHKRYKYHNTREQLDEFLLDNREIVCYNGLVKWRIR